MPLICDYLPVSITLDPRLTFPESVGRILPFQPLLKMSIRVLNVFFPAGGATIIDSFEHVD